MSVDILELAPTPRHVIEAVLRRGPITRTELARVMDLSSPSLTRLTAPLLEAGYLREGEPRQGELGRPARPLSVVDSSASFLGVKVVPGELHLFVCGLAGRAHETRTLATDTATPQATAAAIAAAAVSMRAELGIAGIGVALAGNVDPLGTVRGAHLLGWPEANLSGPITEATGLQCIVANDVDALTHVQHWLGAGRGTPNFVTLTIGSGIGGGAVVDGQLLIGHQGYSAMLDGLWCSDGRTFHDALSTRGLTRAVGEALGREVTSRELEARTPTGADGILRRSAAAFAELALLAKDVWGPERILLSGEGIWLYQRYQQEFHARLEAGIRPGFEPPEIVVRELRFLDWAHGAAALAIRQGLAR